MARLLVTVDDTERVLPADLVTRTKLLTAVQTINNQTGTTYTPTLTDLGALVTCTNAAAITITLPQDADLTIPIGGFIEFVPLGVGMITFVAGTGATVLTADTAVTRKTNSVALAEKIAANTWLVVGDLAA